MHNNSYIQHLVSTIIPVHNRPSLLKEAVQSVLDQTYRPIEIIIVDDGSTDGTPGVADELADRYPSKIRVIHQKNAGPGVAREAGRLIARGEFVQYLDSDDLLLPIKFELQVSGLKANPECGVSYGKTRFYKKKESTSEISWKRTGENIKRMFPLFLMSRWWGTSTPLYRRKVIDVAGPWTSLINEEDWEYDCRIAIQDFDLHYVPEFVSDQRDHSGERLSRYGSLDKSKLQSRAAAHALILQHAQKAGITINYSEMQHFARELFLLSRQCGAAGLPDESQYLFQLARKASGKVRGNGMDFKLYNILAKVIGWQYIGKITCESDKFRKRTQP